MIIIRNRGALGWLYDVEKTYGTGSFGDYTNHHITGRALPMLKAQWADY